MVIRREEVAYGIEIQMALDGNRPDIVEKLRQNLDKRRKEVLESP